MDARGESPWSPYLCPRDCPGRPSDRKLSKLQPFRARRIKPGKVPEASRPTLRSLGPVHKPVLTKPNRQEPPRPKKLWLAHQAQDESLPMVPEFLISAGPSGLQQHSYLGLPHHPHSGPCPLRAPRHHLHPR